MSIPAPWLVAQPSAKHPAHLTIALAVAVSLALFAWASASSSDRSSVDPNDLG
jgi:hypothetical protein